MTSFICHIPHHMMSKAQLQTIFTNIGADFAICAGAIDGLLIWIGKPTPADCEEMPCDSGKFFCGQKSKFGLNCQAVADRHGQILDLSIKFPGSTLDCLAFEASSLYQRLNTNGFLAEGLCLFGDNAYLNAPYMATLFTGAMAGSVDTYNFYHSQLRLRVECASGILTEQWQSCEQQSHTTHPFARQ